MDDISHWLDQNGLGRYADLFSEHAIDFDVLPELEREDFRDLGIPIGDIRRLLRAIRGLEKPTSSPATPGAARTDAKLAPASADTEAQRRQLTVMFADLVGSTKLSRQLDPEDLRETNRLYQDAARAAIEKAGGFIARYMGDGVLAYFGYPQAHEDDAECAVRAGLALSAAVPRLDAPGSPLAVRVGIATGPVVVGDIIGDGASQESAVVGETPNLAARLQASASPNQVVLSELTQKVVGARFKLKPLPAQNLKGIEDPVRAYAAQFEHSGQSRFAARSHGRLGPFVGREEETALLSRKWRQVRADCGQVALLVAEAGMGKSRLVEQVRREREDHGALLFQCSSYHASSAFYPVLMQIANSLATDEQDPSRPLEERLADISPSTGEEHLALIANLLGSEIRQSDDGDAQLRRQRTVAALTAYVLSVAAGGSGLCVFEDVHWADPSTLELLTRIVETTETSSCFILATTRPGFVAPWTDHAHCTVLQLSRLGTIEAAELARASIDSIESLTPELLSAIVDRAGGNPLFIEELARALIEARRSGAPNSMETIPGTLQDSLMARLDALPRGKAVAQCGAVLGREFSEPMALSVWDGQQSELMAGLRELEGAALLYRRTLESGSSYVFKHALVQDVAYGSLLRARRQELHGRAAAALLEAGVAETQPELLAHHYSEAKDAQTAIGFWLQAGERAIAQSSYEEGAAHIRSGLALLDSLGRTRHVHELETRLLVALGPALLVLEGYGSPEVARTYARVLERCDQYEALSTNIVPALQGLRLHHLTRGDVGAAGTVAERLLRHAMDSGNKSHLLEGHKAVGITSCWQARLPSAKEHLETALSHVDAKTPARSQKVYLDADPQATCESFLSHVEWLLGFSDKSEMISHSALALAHACGHHYTIGEVMAFRAWLLLLQGRIDESFQVAGEVFELASPREFRVWEALALLVQGGCLIAKGEASVGLRKIDTSDRLWAEMEQRIWMPYRNLLLTEGFMRMGDMARALETVNAGMRVAHESQELLWLPELKRMAAALEAQRGDVERAEILLDDSTQLAQRDGARIWKLRAVLDLAKLLQQRGQVPKARQLLNPLYESFTEGFHCPDLRRAKALISELNQ